MKSASAAGKQAPRATEMDLYAIIVDKGFRNSPDDPWAHMRLQEYLKRHAPPGVFQYAFRMRHKLSALIDDVWSWETVTECLADVGQTLWAKFLAAGHGPCGCGGQWRHMAETALHLNGINPVEVCTHICYSLCYGRCESLPVVVLMGRAGGEGKSFFLAPMKHIFGSEFIQASPQPGSFPLLGLESKRLGVLDDWDFSPAVVPFSTQLLWYEGKPFPISRPQNKDYVGHLLYQGSAPIFITCKEKVLGPLLDQAAHAQQVGSVSQEAMLARRLKVFHFTQKLPASPGMQVPECTVCFANMLQHYASQGARA
jgi:hypothetical protein